MHIFHEETVIHKPKMLMNVLYLMCQCFYIKRQ